MHALRFSCFLRELVLKVEIQCALGYFWHFLIVNAAYVHTTAHESAPLAHVLANKPFSLDYLVFSERLYLYSYYIYIYIYVYISLYYYICVSVTGMLADASIDANIEDAAQFHDSETDSFHMYVSVCLSLAREHSLSFSLHVVA
jgi:hypothetical protein